MSYTPNISLNLDIDYAGLAADLRGQLYDGATQATVGSAISGVFFERPGAQAMYIMRPTIPNGHDGWCDIYVDGAPETVIGFFSINPAELENADVKTSTRSTVSDIMEYAMMSARQFQDVIMDLWAVVVGNASANDATNPTSISYQNVVTGGQVTHILDDTTRTID